MKTIVTKERKRDEKEKVQIEIKSQKMSGTTLNVRAIFHWFKIVESWEYIIQNHRGVLCVLEHKEHWFHKLCYKIY